MDSELPPKTSPMNAVKLSVCRWHHPWPSLSLVALMGLLCSGQSSALAAEQIVLKYAPIQRSLSVQSLRELADTGQAPPELQAYFNLAQQDPSTIRQHLTKPLQVSAVTLDRRLNSAAGKLLLDQISRFVHTPTNRTNRQALRAAMILDASQDQQITLLDTLENYPTATVEVEVKQLLQAYRQVEPLITTLKTIQPWLRGLAPKARPRSEVSNP